MSLADIVKKIENGEITQNNELPDGKYTTRLTAVAHNVPKGGNLDYLSFKFTVVDGEFKSRTIIMFPSLRETKKDGSPMSERFLANQVMMIKQIGEAVGLDVPNKCFLGDTESDNYHEIETTFNNPEYLGKLVSVKVSTTPNKKNPDNPWKNYEFEKIEEKKDPFQETNNEIEVTEEDLPF